MITVFFAVVNNDCEMRITKSVLIFCVASVFGVANPLWALITLIVYAMPMHRSLRIGSEPKLFFLYCTLAFLSVIVTYFGVNLFLGGIHAYN